MELPRTILVAVDDSEASERAYDYALGFAERLGASLLVVHAFELPVFSVPVADASYVASASTASKMMEAGQQILDRLIARRPEASVPVRQSLREGSVWKEILACAEQEGADLLVLGTHGRTGLGRFLHGSVAEHVVREARLPVLVIHEHDVEAPARARATG